MGYSGGYPQAAPKTVRGRYDFAVDGGAIGTIDLSAEIPAGAYITGGWVETDTAITSGGSATVAIKVEAANDIINAAAIGGAPWSTPGLKSVIPVHTGATVVKTTARRKIQAVIATAALTAGVFDVFLEYVVFPD